jgi:cystathionine beta-synthase
MVKELKMASYAKSSVLEAIGNTPIVKLNKLAACVDSEIYVKLEYMNPGGSIKERIGSYILDKAKASGLLKPGGTIIEGTSGNTGVGLAMYAAVHGYKCIFVLADKQSQEKIDNLKAFGARVIVCPTEVAPEDPRSYYSVAKKLSETIPNSYYVNQYSNLWNAQAHVETTGPEIFKQTGGDFDAFVATAGTGGTITGVSRYIKKTKPSITTVGVDCEGSIIAHYAATGEMIEAKSYVLEGMGEDFIPENYDFKVIDQWEVVGDQESFLMTRELLSQEGIYCGGSGGAAVLGALKYAKKLKSPQKILVILPDSGNRYASKIFNNNWMYEKAYLSSGPEVSVGEICSNRSFKTISETTTLAECIRLFNEHSVCQLLVEGTQGIQGVVWRKKLLKGLLGGELTLEDPASLAWDQSFKLVDEQDSVSALCETLLADEEVLLVTKNNKVFTMLTQNDLLSYMDKK